jgi:hypothetical protein
MVVGSSEYGSEVPTDTFQLKKIDFKKNKLEDIKRYGL